jgi:hypothetical protein
MSLRPRFSLLTLLILTALVAGGLQYWRGPHWRTLSDPLTAADQALLAGPYYADPQLQLLFHGEVRCKYRNTLAGSELLLIHGQPAVDAPLFVDEGFSLSGIPGRGRGQIPQMIYRVQPAASSTPDGHYAHEKIRCWYSVPRHAAPKRDTTDSEIEYKIMKPVEYTVMKPTLPHLYFVTQQKRVYQFHSYIWNLTVTPIQVAEIDDPELRALIEAELASIPDPQ